MTWAAKRPANEPLTIFYCYANGQVLSADFYWAVNEPLTVFEIPISSINVIKGS